MKKMIAQSSSLQSDDCVGGVVFGLCCMLFWAAAPVLAVEDYTTNWSHAIDIQLNTTSAGANVTESQTDFPVLIRLNPAVFDDFSNVNDDGSDIRFSNAGGDHLPYEIERWKHVDASTDTAEIWVLVDAITGNGVTTITMHYGNTSAADSSCDSCVFSPAAGHRAVLHQQSAASPTDASGVLADGTTNLASDAPGVIGGGQNYVTNTNTYTSFPHSDSLDAARTVEHPNGLTFTFWMYPHDDLDTVTSRHTVISKGRGWNDAHDQDWLMAVFNGGNMTFEAYDGGWRTVHFDNTDWTANTWYQVAMVHTGAEVQWYLNGEPYWEPQAFDYAFLTSDDDPPITVGHHYTATNYDDDGFDGVLDEVRVAATQRSAGWIKLSYQNQKANQTLVTISAPGPKVWNGAGSTNNWSEAANWSGGIAPSAMDSVVFDATSTKNCVLDAHVSINALSLRSGYTGTVSLGGYTLECTSLVTAGGAINVGSDTLRVTGDADFSGLSAFDAGTGTIEIQATDKTASFTHGDHAYHNLVLYARAAADVATVNVTGGGTLDINGDLLFRYYDSRAPYFSFDSGDPDVDVTVDGNIASEDAGGNGGTVRTELGTGVWTAYGNVHLTNGYTDNSNATFVLAAASGVQTVFLSANAPAVQKSGAGVLRISQGNASWESLDIVAGGIDFNGFDLSTAGDVRIVNGSSSTIANLGGRTITIGGNATFVGQPGGLLNLNPSSAWTLAVTGDLDASYATIANSNASASAGRGANTCTDGGGNTNWTFAGSGYRYLKCFFTGQASSYNIRVAIDWVAQETAHPSPDMTSNTAPAPLAAWDNEGNGGAYQIFNDGYPGTDRQAYNANDWIAVDLGFGNEITPDSIHFRTNEARGPSGFICMGAGDTIHWDTLYQTSGLTQSDYPYSGSNGDGGFSFSGPCTKPAVSVDPADTNVTAGEDATFTVAATGEGTLSYQWERNDGSAWNAISGATGADYTLASAAAADDGAQLRCVVSNACGSTASAAATLSVCTPATVTIEPVNASVIAGDTASFSLTAAGSGTIAYQWEQFDNSAWSAIDGATGVSLSLEGVLLALSGSTYRAVIENTCGADTTVEVSLTVTATCEAVQVTGDPADTSVAPGQPALFSIATTGTSPDYQWQRFDTDWTDIDSASGAALAIPSAAFADSGVQFRCIVQNSCGLDTSLAAILHVVCAAIAVQTQPDSLTVEEGQEATFGISATGTDIAYQWQRSSDGVDWSAMAGQTAETMSILATLADNGAWFRCIVTDACQARVASDSVRLTVTESITPLPDISLTVTALSPTEVELNWSRADSVRIWYGTGQIDTGADLTSSQLQRTMPSHAATSATIDGLSPQTTYWFGLEWFSGGAWSHVRTAGLDSVTTPPVDTAALVENRLLIDSLTFDTLRNHILVHMRVDTADGFWYDDLRAGLSYRIGETPADDTGLQTIDLADADTIAALAIESMRFDSAYYVAARLSREGSGVWSPVTPEATDSIRTPSFTWQKVAYWPRADSMVTAANGAVAIKKGPQSDDAGETRDSLAARSVPDSAGGFIEVGQGFAFTRRLPTAPFYVGVRIAPAYEQYAGKTRMYRDSAGVLMVDHGSFVQNGYVWTLTNELTFPFLALVDTIAPQVSIAADSDTAAVAPVGQSIITSFTARDNTGNMIVRFEYGAGNEGYADSIVTTLRGNLDTLEGIIGASKVNPSFGVRARIIVDDGAFKDTIDVSRQVAIGKADEIPVIGERRWTPIRATAELADPSVWTVLSGFLDQNEDRGGYDHMEMRLFRWHSYSGNRDAGSKWVEFAPGLDSLFRFSPGRVFWVKTAKRPTIYTGAGISTSLKQPARVTLPPREWTDCAPPFKFDIMLGDMLDATGTAGDSLQVYRWVQTDSGYATRTLYINGVSSTEDSRDTARLSYGVQRDALTIYNPLQEAVILNIPPTPVKLSSYAAANLAKTKAGSTANGWDIRVQSSSRRFGDLGAVYCGVSHKAGVFPKAPSLAHVSVGVLHKASGKTGGHQMAAEIGQGTIFTLVYENQGRERDVVQSVVSGRPYPEGVLARIFSPSTGAYVPGDSFSVTLEPKERAQRLLVVGSESYLNEAAAANVVAELALAGLYADRLTGAIRVSFTAPPRGESVRFSIYDLRGRLIRRREIVSAGGPAPRTVSLDGKMGPGLYVLRLDSVVKGSVQKSLSATVMVR